MNQTLTYVKYLPHVNFPMGQTYLHIYIIQSKVYINIFLYMYVYINITLYIIESASRLLISSQMHYNVEVDLFNSKHKLGLLNLNNHE